MGKTIVLTATVIGFLFVCAYFAREINVVLNLVRDLIGWGAAK